MSYLFRREDNGEVIEVGFAKMMEQDAAGFIKLDDGAYARRCLHLENERDGIRKRDKGHASSVEPPLIDNLGLAFHADQLAEYEEDRKRHGFHGVEFIPDPQGVEGMMAVKFNSKSEWERYVRHRGAVDRNSRNGSGAMLTPQQFERLRKMVIERYGDTVPAIVAQ